MERALDHSTNAEDDNRRKLLQARRNDMLATR